MRVYDKPRSNAESRYEDRATGQYGDANPSQKRRKGTEILPVLLLLGRKSRLYEGI